MLIEIVVLSLYIATLSVLLIFALYSGYILYLNNKYRDEGPGGLPENITDKTVTIQLPIYNEMYVAERLINTVCEIEYPREKLEIQVLDDSTDETSAIIARVVILQQKAGFDIKHIRREKRTGYKAGALKEGLAQAKGEFIAIFDADFMPGKDFLTDTLRYFKDARTGMVQCRWEHMNASFSLLTRIQAFALNGHFVIEQFSRNRAGFFINFNGTGGVWRRECIEDAGNWHDDTIAEDIDLSYRAQLKGWNFIYLRDITTPADLPHEMKSLKAQQFRWTKGTVETARKILPSLWNSDLSLKMKIQSTFHLTNFIVFPFILLTAVLNVPLVFIKNTGSYDIVFDAMSIFVVAFFSSFMFYLYAQKETGKDWKREMFLFPLFLAGSMGFAVNNSKAFFEGLFSKKSEFVRTPKFDYINGVPAGKNMYSARGKTDVWVIVEFFLAAYCLTGVIASLWFLELAALPFQFMYFTGFGSVAMLSVRRPAIREELKTKPAGAK